MSGHFLALLSTSKLEERRARSEIETSQLQGSPLVTTAFIPAKNCPYKRDVVTSMHFTITNPHLILFGPSKFCRYIQICSYKHGRYKRASLYLEIGTIVQLIMFYDHILECGWGLPLRLNISGSKSVAPWSTLGCYSTNERSKG